MNWISVKESLPDSDMAVLIVCPKQSDPVWMAYHDGEGWRWLEGMPISRRVTHWQHLPEPPAASSRRRQRNDPTKRAGTPVPPEGRR